MKTSLMAAIGLLLAAGTAHAATATEYIILLVGQP